MLSSVVSTCVTRWAFKRNCFLINVSMSTSVPFPSLSVSQLPRKDIGFEVFFFLRLFNSLLQTCSPITLLGYEPIFVSDWFSRDNYTLACGVATEKGFGPLLSKADQRRAVRLLL